MLVWLIVNPAGTRVRNRTRIEVARLLARDHQLTVVQTTHRGHATTLARQARAAGAELLVVMGGDGTINEVLNGIELAGSVRAGSAAASGILLGMVGGGKTNVFARALGLPQDPRKATTRLLSLLAAGSVREISLGEVAGRRFAFGAGLGLDAAVVREVEHWRRTRRVHDDGVYVLAGLRTIAGWDKRRPRLTVRLPAGQAPLHGHFVVASNGDPYTYLGPRPFRPTPHARFEGNLDVLVGQTSSRRALTRALAGWLSGRALPDFPGLPVLHDQTWVGLEGEIPLPLQVDGEYLGDHTSIEIRSLPRALRVVAPQEEQIAKRAPVAPWWGQRYGGLSRVWAPERPPGLPHRGQETAADGAGAHGGRAVAREGAGEPV
jgi:diacylglycerol kinase family enzyme